MRTIRSWLKIEPHPDRVRMTNREGDDRVIRIGMSKSKWRDAEQALKDAVKCEALDSEGSILRVWEDDAGIVAVQQTAIANESKTELAELARIITESNDAAVGRLVEIIQAALGANAALVHTLSERNRQLETAWQKLLQQVNKDAPEGAATVLGINEQLIMQLLPAIVGGLAGKTQDLPTTNGGKKP